MSRNNINILSQVATSMMIFGAPSRAQQHSHEPSAKPTIQEKGSIVSKTLVTCKASPMTTPAFPGAPTRPQYAKGLASHPCAQVMNHSLPGEARPSP